jgi:SHAQKYF class myb-like DNA-binding protein
MTERVKRKRYDEAMYETSLHTGDMEDSDTEWTSTSSASETYKSNKKKRKQRFTWTDDLHVKFVTSIFDCGLKTSSPKLLHQLMEPSCSNVEVPTTEHIKSHLQKYRANMQKYRKEIVGLFTESYNSALKQQQTEVPRSGLTQTSYSSSTSLVSLSSEESAPRATGREPWMLQQPSSTVNKLPSTVPADTGLIPALGDCHFTSPSLEKLLETQTNLLKHQRVLQLKQAQIQEQLSMLGTMQEKVHDKIMTQYVPPPSTHDFPLDSMLTAEDLDFLF